MRIAIIGFLIALLLVFSASSYERYTSGLVSQAPSANTPIQHIVIIMQENHAFDNMFGTFPNLPSGYAENLNTCMPMNPPAAKPCIYPWNADSKQSTIQGQDIPHTRGAALKAYNNRLMNGFVKIMPTGAKNFPMAYYDGKILPYYWDYASYYTLNYNFYSSAMSYSLTNHLFAVAGQAGTYASTCLIVCDTTYNLTFPQIGLSLSNAGIPWGYYQYNWNDALNCPLTLGSLGYIGTYYTRNYINAHNHGGFDGLWSGLTDFKQIQANQPECNSLGNLKDLQNVIKNNTLPSVSWVEPEPQVSDHPGQGTWAAGQQYVSSLINLIEKSPEWSSTVIFLTWDDWGGYYDGVIPTQLDQAGDGFRVPLIAISPYSRSGVMVGGPSQEDFSAFLSTIEYNWGLSSLTARDAGQIGPTGCATTMSCGLFYMLNFAQTIHPLVLASTGVTYPLNSCNPPACTFSAVNIPQNLTVYDPNAGINESQTQALSYSGNGDPAD
ncbi:MAG: hypothetical protein OK457_05265 [Thaumarchaeota archaeon]|nr:hypothetical protein [Nitrososphaerota archaeon]